MNNPVRYFNSSPEVIRLAVMMVIRYPLSLRQVEDILFERGIDISYETAGSPGSAEVSEAHDEAPWSAVANRYRPTSILFGCDEGARKSWTAEMRALAQQQSREFAPTVSKAGRGDGAGSARPYQTNGCYDQVDE